MIVLHGIKNCDTMKKARVWLDAHGVEYTFRDYKTDPPAREEIAVWAEDLGWQNLLNRAGTTFRKLPEGSKADLDAAKAVDLMTAQPSMIKRPLLDIDGQLSLGFKPEDYATLFPG